MTTRPLTSPLWFVVPLLAVYTAAYVVVQTFPWVDAPGAVAAGLTLDLVVLVPALYYAVFIRRRGWPAITLAPVFLLSFGAASLVVPDDHRMLLHVIGYALPVVECALVGYIGYKTWRIVRAGRSAHEAGGDFYDRTRRTLQGVFDIPAVAGALAYEVSLFYFAFSIKHTKLPEQGFTYHHRSGYGAVFAAILLAATVEFVAVYFLLWSWSETVALIHIGLSAYSGVWLVGDYRSMRRRPHELRDAGLYLRCGLRWDLGVGWSQVSCVRRTRQPAPADGYLGMVPVGRPRYVVEFHEPVQATGFYGITRNVTRVGFVVDGAEAFEARLRSLGVRVES